MCCESVEAVICCIILTGSMQLLAVHMAAASVWMGDKKLKYLVVVRIIITS